MLTLDRLKEVLDYNKDTGIFTYLLSRGRCISGSRAGRTTNEGYISICIDRKQYLAHRLAWLHVTGTWPKKQIDHMDRLKANNAFGNLRDVTCQFNVQNKIYSQSNKKYQAPLGVTWKPQKNKWYATISINGVRKSLGYYQSAQDAGEVYELAKQMAHPGYISRAGCAARGGEA